MGSSSTVQSCMEAVVKALCKKGEESDFSELQISEKKGGNNNIIGDGWSLIQHDLCNPKKDEKQVYVHPLVKRLSNTLSIKSLEMCTESLGSETGSDISETIEESSDNNNYSRPSKCGKKHTTTTNKTLLVAHHFPPPLTSINNGLQLRSHREGDRLILKATTITAPKSCFKAERLDGRLTLSFWNNTEDVDQSDRRKLLGDQNGYIRPIRKCKSRIKGIPTWEPFWVSIS